MKKYVSKSSNYSVILAPSTYVDDPVLGRRVVGGKSVRFEGGIAVIHDEAICRELEANKGFNRDFFLADGDGDMFAESRKSIEPKHDISTMEYGYAKKGVGDKTNQDEMREKMAKAIDEGVKAGIRQLMPTLFEELKKQLTDNSNKEPNVPTDDKPKAKRPGRPQGTKNAPVDPVTEAINTVAPTTTEVAK